MNTAILNQLRDIIQDDIGKRGLRTDPERNLRERVPRRFRGGMPKSRRAAVPGLAIVTGFFVPTASPPAGETDGPLGALFLARYSFRSASRSPSSPMIFACALSKPV